MDRDTLVTRIGNRFNFRTDLDSKIQDELLNAQIELEEEIYSDPPWFLLSEVAQINGVAGEERIPLPSDFLLEYEEGTLYRFDASLSPATADPWIELKKGYVDSLKMEYVGQGTPLRYALSGEYFRVFPNPDAVYTFKMQYYQRDAPLSSNIENQWTKFAPWVIGGLAGSNLSMSLRDNEAAQYFSGKFAAAFLGLEKKMRAREESNNDASMDDMDP